MAGLVVFWSLAAFVIFVAALVWRPASGNLLSAPRRRAFSAVLGAATGGLSLAAYQAPPPYAALPFALSAPRSDLGATLLAGAVGIAFALAVNAQLARLARPGPSRGVSSFFLVLLGGLAALLPLAVPLAHPAPPLAPLVRVTIGPALPLVIGQMDGAGCGVPVKLPPSTSAHRACAPTPGPHLERQWVISTALTVPEAKPAYLVRVCAHEDERGVPAPVRCTYSLEHEPPGEQTADVHPYRSGTPVDPDERLTVSFERRRQLWAIDTERARAFYDAWTLGPALERVTSPDVERRFVLVPPQWTLPLTLWAAGAALALWSLRAAQRRQTALASAQAAEIRDGLLHVEGEGAPRLIVERAGDPSELRHGPALWRPARPDPGALGYRGHPLALAEEIALGDLDEHRHAARGATLGAFALLASVVGCGPLPLLVAAVGHALAPVVEVHFGEHRGKVFVDTRHACAENEVLVDGSYRQMPTPLEMLNERLPPAFCIAAWPVTIDSYRACAASGACAEPPEPKEEYLGPASPVEGVSDREAGAYCAHEGMTVATPAEVLAGLDARRANPARWGYCTDDCPRSEDIDQASSAQFLRCTRPPQTFDIDEGR